MDHIAVHHPGGSYDIVVGDGALARLGTLLAERGLTGRPIVITDEVVGQHYGAQAIEALVEALPEPALLTFPSGEVHKNLDTVRRLYDDLLSVGADRSCTIVALGGGVVGDTVGFVAATYMRGLPLVQVPTTLLAMVDASVGGKVGVDLPQGKNLVGAFHQPRLVVVDPTTLRTLPEDQFRAGMAEVVKAGVIGDPELFTWLEQHGWDPLSWTIQRAIHVKVAVVEADPFEKGQRAVLNLGHTFGHALELLSDYRLLHGYAVSMGMVIAARVATKTGTCEAEVEQRVTAVLKGLGLPIAWSGPSSEQVWAAMAHDKKRRGGRLRFVLPVRIGQVIITDQVSREVVLSALEETRLA